MRLDEPHLSPERSSPTRLSTSGHAIVFVSHSGAYTLITPSIWRLTSYLFCHKLLRWFLRQALPSGSVRFFGHLVTRGFLITHNDAPQSVGLLLDEWSACRRDLYLTTHNRQTSMPPVGFESTIAAGHWDRLQGTRGDRVQYSLRQRRL
jgi:hypothetical protein